MIGCDNSVHFFSQKAEKFRHFKTMPHRRKRREIFPRQAKEPHRREHPPAILGMRRSQELFLQMNEPARGLNQPFEIIGVLCFRAQPEVLEDIVRFVVTLRIPAAEKSEVTRMIGHIVARSIRGRAA